MKLSLVTETYPPEINGVAMTLDHLASGLVSRGHEVQIVRPRQKGEKSRSDRGFVDLQGVAHRLVPGMPIPLYKSLRMGLPVLWTLQRLWTEARPDVVHIATEGPLGLAALWAASKLRLPVTSTFHTNFHQYGGHYGLKIGQNLTLRYLRWFHNRTRCTLVPTDQLVSQLEKIGFKRLGVLARGVDAVLFSPEKRSSKLRATWGAGEIDPVAIYVGRLAAEKNLRLAVEAFLALQRIEPRAKFVLVGDGPERAALHAKYPNFEYAGVRRDADLAAHYASGDIFIFPSTTETFGNVITEAMASGLVLLSYDYAAARQYVTHGINGFVAPLNEGNAFLRAAAEIMLRREEWVRVRAQARATALSISWDAIIDRFEFKLSEILGGGSSGAQTPAGSVAHSIS